MLKKLNVMMLALCCVSNLNSMDLNSPETPENQFIARNIEKNEIALHDFNVLLKKFYESDLDYSSSEAKCLIDAQIAKTAQKFSWGFKWLVPFVISLQKESISRSDYEVYSDRFLDIHDKSLNLQESAIFDLIVFKNIRQKASEFTLEKISDIYVYDYIVDNNMKKGIVNSGAIGPKKFTPGQSYDAHSSDVVTVEFDRSHDHEQAKINKRNEDLQTHLKKPFIPQYNESRRFSKAPWGSAKIKETVAEHLARLKTENPVDKNPSTNKYAKLFDRIA